MAFAWGGEVLTQKSRRRGRGRLQAWARAWLEVQVSS